MLSRRSFIVSGCALMTLGTNTADAEWGKELLDWFLGVVKDALPSLDEALDFLLHAKHNLELLLSSRARLNDVRRRLTDPTTEHHVEVRLEEWLKYYDAWAAEKPRPGESAGDFAARHERQRVYLQADWQACKGDALDALLDIKILGDELQNIDSKAMPSEEWRAYRRQLDDEKTVIELLNADMPTNPYVIGKLREAAERLGQLVATIDRAAPDLDRAIKNAG